MRLTRGVPVGGIDPEQARELARFLQHTRTLEEVAARMDWPADECVIAISNITPEDITTLTDRWQVVYTHQ